MNTLKQRNVMSDSKPRVVVIGAGFGGLEAARALAKLAVHITLIDRKNHHTFQPLLYQVATAGISAGEIAAPIRWILRGRKNVAVLLGEAVDFDLQRRIVKLVDLEIPYEYLIVAAGAGHSYFGHDEWEPLAPGLKTVEDALEIRRRVLLAFELAEIARRALRDEFVGIDPKSTRILLLEGGPRILPAYAPDLSQSAVWQLEKLGVEVRSSALVTRIAP